MGSSIHPRANILTPTWKTLPHTPLSPLSREDALSEDDTDDEVYVSRHEEAAQAERARLAGILRKSQKPTSSKKEGTPKRVRSSLEAVYPGPLECFRITETARKRHGYSNQESDEISAQKRAYLHKFSAPLQAFSAIEALLQAEKAKLSRALAKSSLLNTDIGQNRSKSSFPSYCPNSVDALRPKKKKKTSARSSREGTPTAETSIEGFLMEKAIARLECLEHAFEHTSKGMYAALEELLSQTNCAVPTEKSFVKLQSFFDEARTSHDSMRLGTPRLTLSELIKTQINANVYPLLAESFKLNTDYQIEGRELHVNGRSRSRRKRSGYSNAMLNGLHKGKLHSYGFTLDLNLFKQDNNHQNISDPNKTPGSGTQTPASQPSTPSSIRRVSTENPIHTGDLHLSGPTNHLTNELYNPTVAHHARKQNGPTGLSTLQLNGTRWGDPLHNGAENAQNCGLRTTAEPEHQSEYVEQKLGDGNNPQSHPKLENVSNQPVDVYASENPRDIEPQIGNRTECNNSAPVNPNQQLEEFGKCSAHEDTPYIKQQLEDDSHEEEHVRNHLPALCEVALLPNSTHRLNAGFRNHQATTEEERYSNPHAQVNDASSNGKGGQIQRHGESSLIADIDSGFRSHFPLDSGERTTGAEGEDQSNLPVQPKSLSNESSWRQGSGTSPDVITIE